MKSTGHVLKSTVLAMAFWCLVVLSVGAHAANLNVYCGGKRPPNTINGALKFLNPQGPNTLTVYGTCNENVLIQTFDNLTLQAGARGATINDASGGTNNVINISDSTRITIQGFTINGTNGGIYCSDQSLCRLKGNTIEGDVGVGRSRAVLTGNVIENSAGDGLSLFNASQASTNGDTIQGHAGNGVSVGGGSFLRETATTVQGNGYFGLLIADNATLSTGGGNLITGNADTGVFVERASMASFGNGDVVTANGYGLAEYGGDGVAINNLSFGRFGPNVNISGNFSGTDVNCRQPLAATEIDKSIGGTTNCAVPSQPSNKARQGAR